MEELYDLEADLGERKNLAGEMPGKVAQMRALMHAIESRKIAAVEESE